MYATKDFFQTSTSRRSTVLVVDDAPAIRLLVQQTLGAMGLATHAAADGDEALKRLSRYQVDAVVTDLEMPKLSGQELIKRIRCHPDPSIARLPIIAVSSLSDDATRGRVRFIGADAFLPKPVDVGRLTDVTTRLLPLK